MKSPELDSDVLGEGGLCDFNSKETTPFEWNCLGALDKHRSYCTQRPLWNASFSTDLPFSSWLLNVTLNGFVLFWLGAPREANSSWENDSEDGCSDTSPISSPFCAWASAHWPAMAWFSPAHGQNVPELLTRYQLQPAEWFLNSSSVNEVEYYLKIPITASLICSSPFCND